ncbi:MAG: Mbeg1-like protein [Reyranella sp.]
MSEPSATLTNAILAMDVYNRGANPGLVVNFNTIGNYQVIAGSLLWTGSFQAATYQLVNDPTTRILAYRGTDQIADVLGWLGGAGIVGWPTQFPAAEAYFKTWGTTAHVSLTGHSLGGGLAGYIAAVNDKAAYAFDAMPFEFAAEGRYEQIHGFFGELFSNSAARYDDIHMVSTSGEVLSTIRALAPPVEAIAAIAQFGPVAGALVTAKAAIGIAAEQKVVLDAGVNFGLDAVSLHSASLVVLLQYASDNAHTSWSAAAAPLMTALYDDGLASAVGIAGAGSDGAVGSGHWSASEKMKAMIGYSAVTDATGFGNTAIQALFHAGDALGAVESSGTTAGYLKALPVETALADIVVEYSALLAENKDYVIGTTAGPTGHEHGALFFDSSTNLLEADFSPTLWQQTATGTTVDILGKTALIDAILSFVGDAASLLADAEAQLWDGVDHLTALLASTTDSAASLNASTDLDIVKSDSNPLDGTLVVAGKGNDSLTGSGGDDLLIGGTGHDVLAGGGGNDILVSGSGDDVFRFAIGGGHDVIINGTASNTTASGELQLGAGVTADNLWFVQSGSDLEIEVMGTHDTITVADWFDSTAYQLRDITAGGLKLDAEVTHLVQAMATYSAGHPGFDPTNVAQAPNDAALHAAIAASWHV